MKIIVTQERFDEEFSIDDWFNLSKLTNYELYQRMIHFCVDEDGKSLTAEEARAAFKLIPRKEWKKMVADFYQAITDAFVNPTNGDS